MTKNQKVQKERWLTKGHLAAHGARLKNLGNSGMFTPVKAEWLRSVGEHLITMSKEFDCSVPKGVKK